MVEILPKRNYENDISKKEIGEVSIAFFSYNLKRTINILGIKNFLGYLVNHNIMKAA